MEELIERMQDNLFLIYMVIFSISVFAYIVTEKMSFLAMFLCFCMTLLTINKEAFLVYGFIFFVLGILSFISMLDVDMWIEMSFIRMSMEQKLLRSFYVLLLIYPVYKILTLYSFFKKFSINIGAVIIYVLFGVFLIMFFIIVPRYMLVITSRIFARKKITSFVVSKAHRHVTFYGMIQSKALVKDGHRDFIFEVSNRAYKILKRREYLNVEMVIGTFGCIYIKNNFLGKERLKTLKKDLPRFFSAFFVIGVLAVVFIFLCYIFKNYAWVG